MNRIVLLLLVGDSRCTDSAPRNPIVHVDAIDVVVSSKDREDARIEGWRIVTLPGTNLLRKTFRGALDGGSTGRAATSSQLQKTRKIAVSDDARAGSCHS